MITFERLLVTMEKRGISTYQLRERCGIDSKTIRRLRISCAPHCPAAWKILRSINQIYNFTKAARHNAAMLYRMIWDTGKTRDSTEEVPGFYALSHLS